MSQDHPVTPDGVTRRGLLRTSAAGSVGIALGSLGAAAAGQAAGRTSPVTIGLISDTHIRDTARAEITPLEDQKRPYQLFTDSMNQVVKPDFAPSSARTRRSAGSSRAVADPRQPRHAGIRRVGQP